MVWFLGMANPKVSFNFTPDPPWLPWQRNLGQNWLQLTLCKRCLRDFCVYMGVFADGPANVPIEFYLLVR